MTLKFVKNTAVYSLAGLVPFIVNFFMLPVYTRFLTPDAYGALALLNTLSAFLLVFMGLQLGNSLFRFYFEYDLAGAKRFFSTVVYATVLFNIVFVTLVHCFGESLVSLVFSRADITYVPYVVLVLGTAFFSSLNVCASLMLKVRERAGTVLTAALVHVVLGVGLNLYFVVHKQMGALGVLTSSAINSVFHTIFLFWCVRSCFVAAFDRTMLRSACSYSLPLIANTLSIVLTVHTDKWVLGFTVPIAQVGLYNIAQRFSSILEVIVRAFKDSSTPSFMEDSVRDKIAASHKYGRLVTKWAVWISLLALGLAFFSEEVIMVMTPPDYHGAYAFVPPLAAAYIFWGLYLFCSNALLFEKKTALIPVITLAGGLFNIAANILLIPIFGAVTAAYTTLATHAMTFVLALLASRRHYRLAFDVLALVHVFGLTLLIFLAVCFVKGTTTLSNLAIKAAGVVVLLAVFYTWNYGGMRGDIHRLWQKVATRRSDRI